MLFRAILSIMLQELQRAVGRKKKNQRRTVWDSGNQESGWAETKNGFGGHLLFKWKVKCIAPPDVTTWKSLKSWK